MTDRCYPPIPRDGSISRDNPPPRQRLFEVPDMEGQLDAIRTEIAAMRERIAELQADAKKYAVCVKGMGLLNDACRARDKRIEALETANVKCPACGSGQVVFFMDAAGKTRCVNCSAVQAKEPKEHSGRY